MSHERRHLTALADAIVARHVDAEADALHATAPWRVWAVAAPTRCYDFWPQRGTWVDRVSGARGRGVPALLVALGIG